MNLKAFFQKNLRRIIDKNYDDVNTGKTVNNIFKKTIDKIIDNTIDQSEYKIIIRPATLDDVKDIYNVEEQCFPEAERYNMDLFRERISGEAGRRKYFVATRNNEIVGYGEVAIKNRENVVGSSQIELVEKHMNMTLEEQVGVLISSGVLPSMRGKGIGKKLTEKRIEYLNDNQIYTVFAHAWPNGGFPYLSEKMQFECIPQWDGRTYSDGTRQILYYKYTGQYKAAKWFSYMITKSWKEKDDYE
jgi:ribosomal protein S18 acetylase RimI-like enzyme